jgi:hypothetical protein
MADKVEQVLREFKHGGLHSGSKKGPMVKSRQQAIAIGLSEARKAGQSVPRRKKARAEFTPALKMPGKDGRYR